MSNSHSALKTFTFWYFM